MLVRFGIVWLLFTNSLSADSAAIARVDEIFKEWNKPDSPGVAVAVIRGGELMVNKGYGAANLEYGIPISGDTVFHVASVSKQFTAMAMVLLEQRGRLSLEDDIRKYLPELHDFGHKITARQLLQHTSGIRDQWQTLALAGWRLDDVITQKQILNVLFHQKELNFVPGAEHLYSNGGYTLAAEIVARVSGKPFPKFCDENIFKPLDMTRTHFHDDHRRIVPKRAYSYGRSGGGYVASPLNYANAGATSLFTTGPDLAKWLDNFRVPKVGGRAGVDRLQEQAVLADGKKINYAMGVSIGTFRGLKTISHGGGDAGYRSYAVYFPDEKLGVVVLSNAGFVNPGQSANKVAELLLADKLEKAPPKQSLTARKFIELDRTTLDRYVGHYRFDNGLILEVKREEGKLIAGPPDEKPIELKALEANRFYVNPPIDGEITFERKEHDVLTVGLTLQGSNVRGRRMKIEPFDPKQLPDYAGAWWSDELETQYTLRVKKASLIAEHIRHGELTLRPVSRDIYVGDQWFFSQVRFERDTSGKPVSMIVGGGRVRGVRFVRQ